MSVSPRRILFAWFALVVFLGGVGLPLVSTNHLSWDDDIACGSADFVIGHRITEVGSPQAHTVDPSKHCELCHWQRSLAGAAPVSAVVFLPPIDDVASRVIVAASDGHAAFVARLGPARAPPPFSL